MSPIVPTIPTIQAMEAAVAAHRRGALAEAEAGYRAVLGETPNDPRANYLLGVVALQTGRAGLAEGYIARSLASGADVAEVHYHLGLALQTQGKIRSAIAAFKTAIERDPAWLEREAVAQMGVLRNEGRRFFWSAPHGLYPSGGGVQSVFETIYERAVWGGGSGAGSNPDRTCLYVAFVQSLMERHNVRSIVDVGCGDWRFSHLLDFGDRDYLGIDIVPSVVAANREKYGTAKINFAHGDATRLDALPRYDMLVCKDVLQHLSNANVQAFLAKIDRAACVLITNDYHPANDDCSDGSTRPLDISRPPFEFPARPVLAFAGKVVFCNR